MGELDVMEAIGKLLKRSDVLEACSAGQKHA